MNAHNVSITNNTRNRSPAEKPNRLQYTILLFPPILGIEKSAENSRL